MQENRHIWPRMLDQVILVVMVCALVPAAWAHSPHDEIVLMELSPDYGVDGTLFVSIQPVGDFWGRLLKSTNGGGSWAELGNGLDNKSYLTAIALSPAYPIDQTLFLGSSGDGVFKSTDGGRSWAKPGNSSALGHIRLLAVSPDYLNDQVLLAGGDTTVFLSQDGGMTWTPCADFKGNITAITLVRYKGLIHLLFGDANGSVWISGNRGSSWKLVGAPLGSAVTAICCKEGLPSELTCLVGTRENGIFEMGADGATVVARSTGLATNAAGKVEPITSINRLANADGTSQVFAATWSAAIFASGDDGKRWLRHESGITKDPQADQQHRPHFSRIRASSAKGPGQAIFLAGFDGLFKSEDAGKNWRQVETLRTNRLEGFDIAPDYATSGKIAAVTHYGGVELSQDGGRTWVIANHGLRNAHLWGVAFSPSYETDKTLIAIGNQDIYKSISSGLNWVKLGREKNQSSWIMRNFFRPQPHSKLFPLKIALSPTFENDEVFYLGTRWKGVFRSEDCGLTCSAIWNAHGGWVGDLAISPAFQNDGTLYAAVIINGPDSAVYKTTDFGHNWQRVGDAIHQAMAGNPAAEARVAISPDYAADGTVMVGTVDGLFRSTDAGQTFQKPLTPSEVENGYIRAIAFSPNYREDGMVLVSVKGRGLFQSVDRGAQFISLGSQIPSNAHQFQSIHFSPNFKLDQTVFGAAQGELLKSTNAGVNWTIASRPARYEDLNPAIEYKGQWKRVSDESCSACSVTVSKDRKDVAVLHFFGTGTTLRAKSPGGLKSLAITLDGEKKNKTNGLKEVENGRANLYSISGLRPAPHVIRVEWNGAPNAGGTAPALEIDYFDIYP